MAPGGAASLPPPLPPPRPIPTTTTAPRRGLPAPGPSQKGSVGSAAAPQDADVGCCPALRPPRCRGGAGDATGRREGTATQMGTRRPHIPGGVGCAGPKSTPSPPRGTRAVCAGGHGCPTPDVMGALHAHPRGALGMSCRPPPTLHSQTRGCTAHHSCTHTHTHTHTLHSPGALPLSCTHTHTHTQRGLSPLADAPWGYPSYVSPVLPPSLTRSHTCTVLSHAPGPPPSPRPCKSPPSPCCSC